LGSDETLLRTIIGRERALAATAVPVSSSGDILEKKKQESLEQSLQIHIDSIGLLRVAYHRTAE